MNDKRGDDTVWLGHLRQRVHESDKSRSTALVLSVFLGWLGVDRFYLGYSWIGMIKLFTFGGLGLWLLVDIVLLLLDRLPDSDGRVLLP